MRASLDFEPIAEDLFAIHEEILCLYYVLVQKSLS